MNLFRTLSATLILSACTAMPSEKTVPNPPQAAQIPQTSEWLAASRETGRTYRIQAAAAGAEPAGGYPVLYLLDGDAYFPMAASVAQGLAMRASESRATGLLVVGVGYPNGKPMDFAARAEDYTPPSESYDNTGDRTNRKFGGAERFRRFLQNGLKPEIARRFKIHPNHQVLYGHSYGGLFALYMLFNHPADFGQYLVASPSVWWNGKRILNDLPAFEAAQRRQPVPVSVRMTVGAYEATAAPHLPDAARRQKTLTERGMVRHTRDIGKRLEKLPQTAVETRIYPKETHAEAAYSALSDGLKAVFTRCYADETCRPSEKRNPGQPW